MRKSQIQTQIFIYMFAVIVVTLIVIFGAKAISQFAKDTEQVTLVNLDKDIKSSISSAASEYNSVKIIELVLQSDFEKICFTDSNGNATVDSAKYPEIFNELDKKTGNNVFVMKKTLAKAIRTDTVIDVRETNNFFCANNTRGRIAFRAVGKGKYAEIYQN